MIKEAYKFASIKFIWQNIKGWTKAISKSPSKEDQILLLQHQQKLGQATYYSSSLDFLFQRPKKKIEPYQPHPSSYQSRLDYTPPFLRKEYN